MTSTFFRAPSRGLCPKNFVSVPCRFCLLDKLVFSGFRSWHHKKSCVQPCGRPNLSRSRAITCYSRLRSGWPWWTGSTTPTPAPTPTQPMPRHPSPSQVALPENNSASASRLICSRKLYQKSAATSKNTATSKKMFNVLPDCALAATAATSSFSTSSSSSAS
jgi:hypothetical protein